MAQSAESSHVERRNDFDLVAPFYDQLATLVFAGAIRRAQVAMLPELRDAERVLILGGGTGWFLLELLRALPAAHVLYIDKSPKMIAESAALISRAAPQESARVEFRSGTEQSLRAEDGLFDLVVTNFFLDLFSEDNALAIAHGLRKFLAPDGRWLFVDFELPRTGLARLYAQVLFKVMFTFFNVVSRMESRKPPDYGRIFKELGLAEVEHRKFYASIIHAKLLRSV